MLSLFRRLMMNTQGAVVIEYTLIVSLIAVAAIASMRSVGGKVSNVLGTLSIARDAIFSFNMKTLQP
jgi:pilus assembly protein Flp/PilA